MPHKLSRFWQELKRRKVVRVITVYAAAAFVILELVDIIAPNLGLPAWTFNLVLILICVGFIIAIILSWIYDIQPEGGIVKTEPAHKVKEEDIPKSSNGWKIASYISFVVIVALIVLNIIPRSNKKDILDKSIAVLPFINDSPDEENAYFINGTMEAILDNLCKIEDLRVVGRTSVEQYRNAPKPIPVIAEEMNVSYILEGSGQKDGNKVRLTLQLIDGIHDQHLWSNPYIREIEVGQIFDLQSEIAELVAVEIKAVITPEEKQLIEKIPTTSLTGYDFYQRGREEHWKYITDSDNTEALESAENLYNKAIEYDSTFALAYTGLARVYLDKHYWETYFSKNFLDSVIILADISISYDNQIEEAYTVKGEYYREIGQTEQALKEYENAIELNSNSWMAYLGKAELHWRIDNLMSLQNIHKAASLNRGAELPYLLGFLGSCYYVTGFREKFLYYRLEKLKLDGDSVDYFSYLSFDASRQNEFIKGIEYGKKALAIDSSNNFSLINLARNYDGLGQYKQSLIYYQKTIERRDTLLSYSISNMHRLGYAYWQNGNIEEADYYFDKQIDYCNRTNELGRTYSDQFRSYFDLAAVYAFKGEKEKAYENLREYNQKQTATFNLLYLFKYDPLFDSMRDESEFKQIMRDVEAKYQAEHERVRKWLEENDML